VPSSSSRVRVVIIDYGLGNLYSVKQACAHSGLQAEITSALSDVMAADAVILPGVGAFGDAMATLRQLNLDTGIREFVASGKPLLGICLGMQLLMSESHEFGRHDGLGIVPGRVVRLDGAAVGPRRFKVPQIGWNAIHKARSASEQPDPWQGTLLDGVADGEPMYFIHSYVVEPSDPQVVLSSSLYGSLQFCSSLRYGNVMACQFHPERSGPRGLDVYRTWARLIINGEAV